MTTAILEEHLTVERIENDDERCYDLVDGGAARMGGPDDEEGCITT